MAEVRCLRQLLATEGGAARHQSRDAGIQRSPQPGLAGRGAARRSRLPSLLSPGEGGRDTGLSPLPRTRTATTVSPIRNMATGPRWITASWSCRRSGASPSAGLGQWRARPRRSRSAGKRTAGRSASRAPTCRRSHLRHRAGDRDRPWLGIVRHPADGTRSSIPAGIARRSAAQDGPAPSVSPEEGQQSQAQGGDAARQGASEGKRQHARTSIITAFSSFRPTTRSITKTCRRPTCSRTTTSPRASGRRLGPVLAHPQRQSSIRWATVVAVPPAYTSQTCSGCGVVVKKGLSVRWHSCPECGTSLHRDHNAAKNIERLGQSLRGGVA